MSYHTIFIFYFFHFSFYQFILNLNTQFFIIKNRRSAIFLQNRISQLRLALRRFFFIKSSIVSPKCQKNRQSPQKRAAIGDKKIADSKRP